MSRLLRQSLIVCMLAVPAAAQQQWTEVRSPHFLVLTDTGRDTGRKVALRFEQMRQVFGSVLQKPTVRAGVPLNIIAFRTALEMRTALPHDPQAQRLFVSAADADYILLDLSAPDPYGAVARDYANSVIVANTPPLPLWYDVGMAEYFSTVVVSPKEAQLGKPPEIVAQAGSKLRPAAVFLGLDHSSAEYRNGEAGYRAQCWLMVAWLMANHQLAAVNEYARLITMEHLPPASALQGAFNLSTQQLDAELQRFLGTKFATTSYPLPPGFDDVATYSYADRKVFPLEAQASISDFHVHAAAYVDQGIGELENILKQDANNAPAHRALGYAYLQKGAFDKAKEHLAKAVDIEPNNARAHYYSAVLVQRASEVLGGGVASYEIKAQALKALDLDPAYADAWFLLGIAYEIDDNMNLAIDSVLKAIKLTPRNDVYRLALARMYGEAKRFDDATALLTYLKGSSDPEVASQVQAHFARLEQSRTSPKRAGRFDERPRPSSYDAPQWRTKPGQQTGANSNTSGDAERSASEDPDDAAAKRREEEAKPDKRPIHFIKGKLVSAACRPGGAATLTIAPSQGKRKTLQLATPDYKHLVVIGADVFACDWKDVNVAVNYRESSPTTGDLVSLELQ